MSRPGGRLVDGLRLAVGTLTALPVRPPQQVDRRTGRAGMLLAPLAAVPLAAAVAVVVASGRWAHLPSVAIGALAVALLALLSRGLHLDGLADTCDGLAASYDRERALRVMRTGDVGPNGAAALVLVLLLQAALVGALTPWVAAAAVLASRAVLPLATHRRVPAARADGLGAAVVGSVGTVALLVCLAVTAAVCAVLAGWAGSVALVTALAVAGTVVRRAVTRLGGVTGDVLGACVEMGLAGALLAAAVVSRG